MTIQKLSRDHLLKIALLSGDKTPSLQDPARISHEIAIPGAEGAQFGVWESAPGTFERDVEGGEVMHILAGAATFTSREGESIQMQPGDTIAFSPHTHGTWVVTQALRKVYVIL